MHLPLGLTGLRDGPGAPTPTPDMAAILLAVFGTSHDQARVNNEGTQCNLFLQQKGFQ